MATFAAVLSTVSNSSTLTVYYTRVSGTAASPSTGTRTAMTARRTVGTRTVWEADITYDNAWVAPRFDFDDGTSLWHDGHVHVNVVQVAGAGYVLESGTGGDSCTLHFETSTGDVIADADVWLTSDSAGSDTVAGVRNTDSQGDVTFLLNAGTTYYVWMQKDGIEPILGSEYVAVAD